MSTLCHECSTLHGQPATERPHPQLRFKERRLAGAAAVTVFHCASCGAELGRFEATSDWQVCSLAAARAPVARRRGTSRISY